MTKSIANDHLIMESNAIKNKWQTSLKEVIEEVENLERSLTKEVISFQKSIRFQKKNIQKLKEIKRNSASLVHFNVGGKHHAVSELFIDVFPKSMLYYLSRSAGVAKDEENRILIDRDSEVFSQVINCLRGYDPQIIYHQRDMLVRDLKYYGLTSIADKIHEQMHAASKLFLNPIADGGSTFRAAFSVGYIGEKPLMLGKHTMRFRIDHCSYVGIGVVSDYCTAIDTEFHKTPDCCVYYYTGVIYANYPHHTKEEGHERFTSGDIVTIALDMDEKNIKFYTRGRIVRIVDCQTANRLRFAVVMKSESRVTILDV